MTKWLPFIEAPLVLQSPFQSETSLLEILFSYHRVTEYPLIASF